jgi:hypothetical protein
LPAGITRPTSWIESWSMRRLSGRLSSRGLVARQLMTWYFANRRSAKRRKVIGYIRTQRPVARSTPAQQTVSPYFWLGVGYVLTTTRRRLVS